MSYYFICFVVAIVLTIVYFFKWNSNFSTYFSISFLTVIITNLGYWLLSLCDTTNEALIANRVIYTGASFNSLLIMVSIFQLCKVNINKIWRIAAFAFSMLIYLSSLTVGFSDIFYKSVAISKIDGVTVLTKEYGFMHTLYYVMLILYLIIGISVLIYALCKKRDVSMRNAIFLLLCNFMAIVAFAVGRFMGTLDAVPASIDIILFFFYIISDRFILYDVDNTAIKNMVSSQMVGVASFDLNHRFLGCNDVVKEYYPEFSELRVDLSINESEHMNDIKAWISLLEQQKEIEVDYRKGSRYFNVKGRYLKDGAKVRGLQFIFRDCTEEKRFEEHLMKTAITDEMTGLLNRRAFEEEIKKINESELTSNLVIASFDLNGLKKANDTIGHEAGDELIKAAASALTDIFSQYGKVFRIGGDEFSAILYANKDIIKQACEKLNAELTNWHGTNNTELSISRGFAYICDEPNCTPKDLIKIADRNMYTDKSEYYKMSGHDRRK